MIAMNLNDKEISKVMSSTGMRKLQAYRHLQCREHLFKMMQVQHYKNVIKCLREYKSVKEN